MGLLGIPLPVPHSLSPAAGLATAPQKKGKLGPWEGLGRLVSMCPLLAGQSSNYLEAQATASLSSLWDANDFCS